MQENKEMSNEITNDLFSILEFSGWITGMHLSSYGVSIEPSNYAKPYYCNIYFDDRMVYFMTISDRKPHTKYYMASVEKTPDAFWGQGVPHILSHMQQAINSMIRAAIRNVALASGPQVSINDSHRIESPNDYTKLEPWTIWVSTQPSSGEYTDKTPKHTQHLSLIHI